MISKKKYFILYATVFVLLFNACKSDNEIIKPPIDPPIAISDLKAKLDSKKINVFQKILSSGLPSPLEETEVEKYFGDRIALSVPEEIIVKKDSVFLIKQYGVTEGYKSKWDKDDLYLQENDKSSWKLLGKKNNKTDFILSMGFYTKKSVTPSSKGIVLGQEYNMNSYDALLSKTSENTDLVWLQINLLYK